MSGDLFSEVRRHLGPHLLRRDFAARRPAGAVASWGCCYVAAEALYHLLGGRLAGWRPFSGRVQGEPHWWLVGPAGEVLDPTADQFAAPPDYTSGVGKGFLTRTPSRRARLLIAQVHGAIEVDPRRAFGRPVLAGTSAPAEDVAARFLAGEGVAALAADYDAPGEQIEEAIRCSL
jgi:uncharacterized protein (DUF433 family)